jgi:hypothetical protein
MRVIKYLYRPLVLSTIFVVSYLTRPGEIPVEGSSESLDVRTDNFTAGMLATGSSRTKGGNLDDGPGWQNLRHEPIP